MSCAIPGCAVEPYKRNVMCWDHIRMLPDAMQRTLRLLYNDGSGKPHDGYLEACTNAVEQVKVILSTRRKAMSNASDDDEKKTITITEAIARAQDFRANPEMLFSAHTGRLVIGGLLSAVEYNPTYLKAVRVGEPVFILRAQDKLAPTIVRHWADLAVEVECPADKVAEARTKAQRMEQWPTRKYPD